jgi:uncharacterized protein YhaN
MRFSKLHLLKCGHFDDHEMAFPAGGSMDFQIVYGPNEAGKSTTMSAITALLFGFTGKEKFDFRFNRLLMRVGALIENGSNELSCRRRAGNALTDFDDRPIDGALLANLIGGQTADSFNRMFSLNHTGLRDGGQAILAARDDVGQAIFAAGSGLASITTLLKALEDQSTAIWAPRASAERSYYVALESHKEAAKRLKAAQTKPAFWDDRKSRVEDLEAELITAKERREFLARRRGDIERKRRTLPNAVRRIEILEGLAVLEAIPRLPADTKSRLDTIEKELLTYNTELRLAASQAADALTGIDGIEINEALLGRMREFQILRERKGAVEKGEVDVPDLQSKAEAGKTRLGPLLRDLGWAIEDAMRVEARLPSRIVQTQIEDLLSKIQLNESVLKAARDTEANRKNDADKLREENDPSLDEVPFEAIKAHVRVATEKGDVDDAVAKATRALRGKEQTLETALARLIPWTGSVEDLDRLVVPTADNARSAAKAIDEAQKAVELLRASLAEKAKKIREEEFERDQLLASAGAVTAERLSGVRSDRDAVWHTLRNHMLGESLVSHPATEVTHYEDLISRADAVADQRFDGASASAQLAVRVHDLERLKFDEKGQEEELAAAGIVLGAAEQAWRNTLAATGMMITAGEYLAWLAAHKQALDAAVLVREAGAILQEANVKREEARSALVSSLAAANIIYLPDAPTAALKELTDDFVREFEGKQKARLRKQGQLIAADAAVKLAKEAILKAEQERHDLAIEFADVPGLLGFEHETSAETVRLRSKLFGEVRSIVDEVKGYIQRVKDIEKDNMAFYASLTELARDVGIEQISGESPKALLVRMLADVAEMQIQHQARVHLQTQYDNAKERETAAQAKLDATNALLAPILRAAASEDTEALRLILERAQLRDNLEADLERIDKEIVAAEPGKTLQSLLFEVAEIEMEVLVQALGEIETELADLEAAIERATAQHANAKAEFEMLNDGPDAIQAASDQAQALAEMEAQAEAYVGLRTEVAILRYAVERYRKEKQGPLLRRASELFSKLTLGGYAQLLVDASLQKPRLCGVRAGTDEVVGIDGMSEGTVDQLYLALRLAAVENIVASGLKMPFLADDLFINYDDERSQAGFQALGELARQTQVLFFTHHEHLLEVAERALGPANANICRLRSRP